MVLKKNFKIGIIGCGYWAANILNSLKDLGQTNIYVFDKDKDKFLDKPYEVEKNEILIKNDQKKEALETFEEIKMLPNKPASLGLRAQNMIDFLKKE